MDRNLSDVVRSAQQGASPEAQEAFAGLVARFERPLRRFLVDLVHNHHDAEDLAEDVLVRVWQGLPGLKDPDKFLGWMFQMARNRAFDFRRTRKMRSLPGLAPPEIMESFPMAAGDPYLPEMRKAIASLAPDSLQILQLKYEAGMTYKSIAEIEGISVSTVRDRLVLAKERLETVLLHGGFLEPYAPMLEEKRRLRAEKAGQVDGTTMGEALPGFGPSASGPSASGPTPPEASPPRPPEAPRG